MSPTPLPFLLLVSVGVSCSIRERIGYPLMG